MATRPDFHNSYTLGLDKGYFLAVVVSWLVPFHSWTDYLLHLMNPKEMQACLAWHCTDCRDIGLVQ